jgi:hypothetical protein
MVFWVWRFLKLKSSSTNYFEDPLRKSKFDHILMDELKLKWELSEAARKRNSSSFT